MAVRKTALCCSQVDYLLKEIFFARMSHNLWKNVSSSAAIMRL